MFFLNRVLPLLLAASLCACGIKESLGDADAAVASFHRELSAEQYERIWTRAGPELRAAGTKPDFVNLLQAVRRKLGEVRESKRVAWNANTTTGGSFVTVTMDTRFETGTGQEQLTFRKASDGKLLLVGYNIQSNDMMTR